MATITGTNNNDTLAGTAGDDEIFGLGGDDFINGGAGDDRMVGGVGSDQYVVDSVNDQVVEDADSGANDAVFSFLSAYTLGANVESLLFAGAASASFRGTGNSLNNAIEGRAGDDFLFGAAGNDNLFGQGGNDQLDGGEGDDALVGGLGADRMTGGSGDDTYYVDDAGDAVIEDADAGRDVVFSTLATYALSANVEDLNGTFDGGQSLTGNALNNMINGAAGNDTFFLQQGGDDSVSGGPGNDVIYYGGAFTIADQSNGGAATDTLVLQGNYNLTFGSANLVEIEGLSLQSGSVTRFGQNGANSYDYSFRSNDANVASGQQLRVNAQSLRAGEDLTFDGSAETDGKFLIFAGFGGDVLTGGSGNDIFFFEAGRFAAGDRISGNAGNDVVVISGSDPAVAGPVRIEIASGTFTSVESLSFNGRFASDVNATPSYQVILQNGNIASGARLIVNGSSLGANQSLSFDAGAETAGRFSIFGGAGGDNFIGGANGDLFFAGSGADTLTGGAGADVFQYRAASDSTLAAADRILDLQVGTDKIDLSFIDADSATAGDQAFRFVNDAAFSQIAGELRAEFDAAASQWRIQGDVNGDGAADFLILATPTGCQMLEASDFVL